MAVFLIHGDNNIEIDDAVRARRQAFESADILSFDGRDVSLTSLSEATRTAGLFATERLVIVNGLHERMKKVRKDMGEIEEIRRVLGAIPDTTTLLLVDRGMEDNHHFTDLVREVGGNIAAFSVPKKNDLPRWIIARCSKHRAVIEIAAAELMADLVGLNPVLLDSELEKLAIYVGENGRISPEIVQKLVGTVAQDSIFALVDSIAAGNEAQALKLLHFQLEGASSNPVDFALYLIRMMSRQVRILLRIRLGRQAGRTRTQLLADLKIPRYYSDRYFRQADRLTDKRLTGAFEQLAELEHALKTGRVEAATGLDLLVADLCA